MEKALPPQLARRKGCLKQSGASRASSRGFLRADPVGTPAFPLAGALEVRQGTLIPSRLFAGRDGRVDPWVGRLKPLGRSLCSISRSFSLTCGSAPSPPSMFLTHSTFVLRSEVFEESDM